MQILKYSDDDTLVGFNLWGIIITGRTTRKTREKSKRKGKKRGRKPGLVKTKTIKKRKLEIYFPTKEAKKTLLDAARKKGMSSSKYIISCIEEIQTGPMGGPISKDLSKVQEEVQALETENRALRKENDQLLILTGRNALEISLLKTRETPVREKPIKEGVFKFNKRLIALFKQKKEITAEDIIEGLELDLKDRGSVDKVWRDLDSLSSHELVETTMEGWRWLGN